MTLENTDQDNERPPDLKENWCGLEPIRRAGYALQPFWALNPNENATIRDYCTTLLIPALANEAVPEDPKHHKKIARIIDWISGDFNTYNAAASNEQTIPEYVRWLEKRDERGSLPSLINRLLSDQNLSLNTLNAHANHALSLRRQKGTLFNPNNPAWADTQLVDNDLPDDLVLVRCIGPKALEWDVMHLGHCATKPHKKYLSEAIAKDDMPNGMFSLRDETGKPIATLRAEGGKLTDCAGVQNAPILLEHFPAVDALIRRYKWRPDSDTPFLGIVQWGENYHSIYDLPRGFKVYAGDIDISTATRDIVFPDINIRTTLMVRPNQLKNGILPEGVTTKRLQINNYAGRGRDYEGLWHIKYSMETGVITTETYEMPISDGGSVFHRLHGPALIKRQPTTGIVIGYNWFRGGEMMNTIPPNRKLVERFHAEEKAKRAHWEKTGQWPLTVDDIDRPAPAPKGVYAPRM